MEGGFDVCLSGSRSHLRDLSLNTVIICGIIQVAYWLYKKHMAYRRMPGTFSAARFSCVELSVDYCGPDSTSIKTFGG